MRTDDISSDWTAACEVQQRFMYHVSPTAHTLDYSARCRQVKELGGDFYDFLPLSDNRLAVAVGDASGKGLAAALMSSNVQSSLRTATSLIGNDGAKALNVVNRQVYGSSLAHRYATLFYGVFEQATQTLRYVNAGHNPPLVIRQDGSIVRLETGGGPVGLFPDGHYQEGAIQLNPGDMILAYTDGVTEAAGPDGGEWGEEGVCKAAADSAAQNADQVVHAIFTSMDAFSRGYQSDDATVVALRVH